jgi:hypothetical protein
MKRRRASFVDDRRDGVDLLEKVIVENCVVKKILHQTTIYVIGCRYAGLIAQQR